MVSSKISDYLLSATSDCKLPENMWIFCFPLAYQKMLLRSPDIWPDAVHLSTSSPKSDLCSNYPNTTVPALKHDALSHWSLLQVITLLLLSHMYMIGLICFQDSTSFMNTCQTSLPYFYFYFYLSHHLLPLTYAQRLLLVIFILT